MIATEDRIVGCILAGAIGDSFGGPYEGGVGPMEVVASHAAGISDDTQLTLATCEAIREGGSTSPEEVAARFLHWYRRRTITGAGASTLKALRDLEVGAHWSLSGRTGEMAAGNGAAMRIAPLAFILDLDLVEDRSLLRDICWITHRNEEAYCGALAVAFGIQLVASGQWQAGRCLPSLVAERIPDSNTRDGLLAVSGLGEGTSIREVASEVGCSAFVAESVPLAIFASQSIGALGLEEMLLQVIRVGGDTDTNAAIAGNIAGAALGASRIPRSLYSTLAEAEMVMEIAAGLSNRLGLGSRPPSMPDV